MYALLLLLLHSHNALPATMVHEISATDSATTAHKLAATNFNAARHILLHEVMRLLATIVSGVAFMCMHIACVFADACHLVHVLR